MRTTVKTVTFAAFIMSFMLMSLIASLMQKLPAQFMVAPDTPENFSVLKIVRATSEPQDTVMKQNGSYIANLSIGGIIPIGKAVVNRTETRLVHLSGEPIGMKMYTEGVLVVGLTDVDHNGKNVNPASSAGIKTGDIILTVDNTPISSNFALRRMIESSKGKAMELLVSRDSSSFRVNIKPVKSDSDGTYKAGMWVRDSTAGLGTLTFIDPTEKTFAALGHAVFDADTSVRLPVLTGQLTKATVSSVSKARGKSAGSLNGKIVGDSVIGIIRENSDTGIYGVTDMDVSHLPIIRIAGKQEVQTGKASVLCTVKGTKPKYYDIEIKSVSYNESQVTKNMVIEITDAELLEVTGGIVQGMSGSPIIQNGNLVGAVTHVFLNDCSKGYAIFAENMLTTSDSLNAAA
ncbi:MAG: SpoIVB peptidase [Clostridia bacterium]|nr:SpoIVB peptidase [Clostridia bacterium]